MNSNLPDLAKRIRISRRSAIQAGTIGLLNLGMNHVEGLRALGARVTVLRDGCISSSRSTPALWQQTVQRLGELKVECVESESVLGESVVG